MELSRIYYTLPEFAEKRKWSENDLLHLAATGELELSVEYRGWALDQSVGRILLIKSHIQLYPHSVEAFMDGVTKIDIALFKGKRIMLPVDEFKLMLLKQWASERDEWFPYLCVCPFEIKTVENLRILSAEVARMETKFPELAWWNEAAAESVDQAHKETIPPGILYDIPQKELAKKCGVTARTVSNWMQDGLLFEPQGREKRFSLPLTIKWLKQKDKRNELETLNNSK